MVLVGEAEQRFVAHESVLCATSGFFRDSLSGDWLEGKERVVRLPEQSHEAFNVYLTWLYRNTIDLPEFRVPEESTQPKEHLQSELFLSKPAQAASDMPNRKVDDEDESYNDDEDESDDDDDDESDDDDDDESDDDVESDADEDEDQDKFDKECDRFHQLLKSYVLGDMLRDDGFCNALIDTWIDLKLVSGCEVDLDYFNGVASSLPQCSKLRPLATHYLAYCCPRGCFKTWSPHLDPDYWRHIAEVTVDERDTATFYKLPTTRRRCTYHVHNSSEALTCPAYLREIGVVNRSDRKG